MKDVIRAMGYVKSYLPTAVGAFLCLLLVNAANLATPQVLRYLIDNGIEGMDMRMVWIATAALMGIAIVRGLFNFLQGYWTEVTSQGVAYDIRNEIFEKLQNLSFSYHDRAQTGKLMTRMTSDVEMVRMFVGMGFLHMFRITAPFHPFRGFVRNVRRRASWGCVGCVILILTTTRWFRS